MYLSRMYLNPQRRQGRALLASPQKMHAAVLSSFPPIPVESDERVLWRLDRVHEKCVLYMVSPGVPSFEHLQEQAGWSQQQTWDTRDYSTLLDRLLRGQRYYFRESCSCDESRWETKTSSSRHSSSTAAMVAGKAGTYGHTSF